MRTRLARDERGVGLMEVIVATVVAVTAVLALAYTFGMGRGLVDRYEVARVGLAAAQRRMEMLSALPVDSNDLEWGTHPEDDPGPIQLDGIPVAFESWTVEAYVDSSIGSGGADMKQVTVRVTWGRQGPNEQVTLNRLFPLY